MNPEEKEELRQPLTGAFNALSRFTMTNYPLDTKTIRNISDALAAIADKLEDIDKRAEKGSKELMPEGFEYE